MSGHRKAQISKLQRNRRSKDLIGNRVRSSRPPIDARLRHSSGVTPPREVPGLDRCASLLAQPARAWSLMASAAFAARTNTLCRHGDRREFNQVTAKVRGHACCAWSRWANPSATCPLWTR